MSLQNVKDKNDIPETALKRARATNDQFGPVDLSKNENDWVCLKNW